MTANFVSRTHIAPPFFIFSFLCLWVCLLSHMILDSLFCSLSVSSRMLTVNYFLEIFRTYLILKNAYCDVNNRYNESAKYWNVSLSCLQLRKKRRKAIKLWSLYWNKSDGLVKTDQAIKMGGLFLLLDFNWYGFLCFHTPILANCCIPIFRHLNFLIFVWTILSGSEEKWNLSPFTRLD